MNQIPESLSARAQTPEQRRVFLQVIQNMCLTRELTLGMALRVLRGQHLGVARKRFASMVGLSYTALSHLENDTGNPTLASIERAFAPFGFRVGLLPVPGSAIRVEAPDIDPDVYDALAAHILESIEKKTNTASEAQVEAAQEAIFACIEDREEPLSKSEILEATGVRETHWQRAISALRDAGRVEKQGQARGTKYYVK